MGDLPVEEKTLSGTNKTAAFNTEKLKRDFFIDKLKGAAIFLVVWGHFIQYSANNDFFHNPVFIVIYSFHMPVFMAISGYLYYLSIQKREFKQLVTIRFKQLIIPLLIWSVPLLYLNNHFQSNTIAPAKWLEMYILHIPDLLWFIWSLFLCSIILTVVNKFFNDLLWVYFAAIIVINLLPDIYSLQYTKFMLPYFIGGYLVHKYGLKSNLITALSFVFFLVMLYYWQLDDYIYVGNMAIHNIHILYTDIYRYLIGFFGIVVFITIIKWIPKSKPLELAGRYSLGIYILSTFPLHVIHYLNLKYDIIFFNFLYAPLLSVVIIIMCIGINMLIGKNKSLSKYLFGGR